MFRWVHRLFLGISLDDDLDLLLTAWPRHTVAFRSLNEAIASYNNLTTVKQAFASVGFDKAYGGKTSSVITFFAPTDAAWASFFKDQGITASDLLADTASLTTLLEYHMVAGNIPLAKLLVTPIRQTVAGGYIMLQKNQ